MAADSLKAALVLLYARYQAQVGKKVGIERGAAWRAALEAASDVGCQQVRAERGDACCPLVTLFRALLLPQVLLSDRPTAVTERRLGDNLFVGAGLRMVTALGLLIGSVAVPLAVDYPLDYEAGGAAGALLLAAAAIWPVVGPFLEIKRLAGMGPAEIEEAVRVKGPLVGEGAVNAKLFGEDALLDWPGGSVGRRSVEGVRGKNLPPIRFEFRASCVSATGATGPMLEERDEFMARAAANAAAGSEQGLCPAYVLDRVDGQLTWRFMQAKGAPEMCR